MNSNNSALHDIEVKAEEIKARLNELEHVEDARLDAIWKYLQQSEKLMRIIFDAENKDEKPDVGDQEGELEYGPILYMLHHLPEKIAFITALLEKLGMPASDITPAIWGTYIDRLKGEGYYGGDGTLLQGDGSADYLYKYVQLDPGWAFSAYEYVAYLIDLFGLYKRADFGTTPHTTNICDKELNELTIAIVGDWGTGVWTDGNQPKCPSQLVMKQLTDLNPDVIIHLGDVYYAGNEGIGSQKLGEEYINFVSQWPSSAPKLSFTLNSNHEMYGGGNGYFKVAMASDIFQTNQTGTSYFAINYGAWLIVGLDSAYYDTSTLYMSGALYDENVEKSLEQKQFMESCAKSAKENNQRLIVMTHHNPLLVNGEMPAKAKDQLLWDQMTSGLGYPDYWYWGHVHNAIIYTDKSGAGSNTHCRCIGHGAIPFAKGYELEDAQAKGVVDYYAKTPMVGSTEHPLTESQKLRVLNGFATITLKGDSITEKIFETGNPQAVWTSSP